MNKILDVVEDIKQNITDNQYKIIMDSLMEIHKTNKNSNLLPILSVNQKLNKFASFFNWLDTKLEITENDYKCIKKTDLQKYIITNYFDNRYYQNIDFVKQVLKIYFI
jgi:hypothetical protein